MWWVSDQGYYMARGIYGQALYVDPVHELVIARFGSHPLAANTVQDPIILPGIPGNRVASGGQGPLRCRNCRNQQAAGKSQHPHRARRAFSQRRQGSDARDVDEDAREPVRSPLACIVQPTLFDHAGQRFVTERAINHLVGDGEVEIHPAIQSGDHRCQQFAVDRPDA